MAHRRLTDVPTSSTANPEGNPYRTPFLHVLLTNRVRRVGAPDYLSSGVVLSHAGKLLEIYVYFFSTAEQAPEEGSNSPFMSKTRSY